MIKTVLVVGGGSAGFLAAMIVKKKLPALSVAVVRSKEMGVIGVGESTTVAVPRVLHGYLELDPGEFYRQVLPSWKLGLRLLWGPRPFFDYAFDFQLDVRWDALSRENGYYCHDDWGDFGLASAMMTHNKVFERQPNGSPLITRNFGYHIENQRFVAYLEAMAARMGIAIRDEVITGATQDENGITGVQLASGAAMSADLYLDCSGFRTLLLGKTFDEPFIPFKSTLFCDRAVVGTWTRTDEIIQPYTTAETMTAGWCWQIDHPDCIMRGYVYSSSFISDEDAEREFRTKNPKVATTRIVNFVSGRYVRTWVKNVVAIGNAAGFVEPLESTSLAVICDESRILADCLVECDRLPRASFVHHYNRINARAWDTIRDFLGIHYKFNTRLDTPFWQACRADTELGPVQELVDFYQENGPSTFARTNLIHGNDLFGMEGYMSLLVGQKVPYRARHTPTSEELAFWNGLQAENRRAAQTAFSVREALDGVLKADCRWKPGFFKDRSLMQLTNYIGSAS